MVSESSGGLLPPFMMPGTERELFRFSVARFHLLYEKGVYSADERMELLNGLFFEMPKDAVAHDALTAMLRDQLTALLPDGYLARMQQPAVLSGFDEPKPDLAIVRGAADDYAARDPQTADVALLIEVAEDSHERDQELKQELYAAARLPEYWIVNMRRQQIEVYTEPVVFPRGSTYRQVRLAFEGEQQPLRLDGREVGVLEVGSLSPAAHGEQKDDAATG